MRFRSIAVLLAAAGASFSASSQGQTTASFPSKPVRVLLGFAPGGSTDIQARLFAQKMGEALNQPFVVENRPSAGGAEALGMVAKGPKDGYMLLAASSSFTVAPALLRDLPADPIKDFAPISIMTKAPYVLAVHPSVPTKSVSELIALAKAKPGALNFGGGPIGSSNHLVPLWFFSLAHIKVIYVPYKGSGPSLIALMGGEIDAAMGNIVGVVPHLKSGKLRALGVSSAQRSTILPSVPTIAEQGVPQYDYVVFLGFVTAAGTPAAIVNKLSVEFARVVKLPEIEAKLREDGAEPVGSSPEQFSQLIAAEVPRWRKMVQEAGIKAE